MTFDGDFEPSRQAPDDDLQNFCMTDRHMVIGDPAVYFELPTRLSKVVSKAELIE